METVIGMGYLFAMFAVIIVGGSLMVWINDGWNGGPK